MEYDVTDKYSTQTPKKSTLFSGQYLRNRSTLDTGVLGYIGIVWPKEHCPEVWSVPPVTPCIFFLEVEGKAVPLQAWSGPEVSRKLRFPDFMTTAQVIRMSVLRTGRIHPQEILLVLISVRGYVDRKDYVNKKFQWHHLKTKQRPYDL